MPDAAHKRWTLDEFLTWEDGTDRHYELVAGEIVAMAPPSRAHGTLAVRVARIFDEQLRAPCSATAQAGIVLPDRDDAYYELRGGSCRQLHSSGTGGAVSQQSRRYRRGPVTKYHKAQSRGQA